MTNIERLQLELNNKNYFGDELQNTQVLETLLEENYLDPYSDYEKMNDEINLLKTVYAILRTLSNNLDNYRKIETEFVTQGQAQEHLTKRMNAIQAEITKLQNERIREQSGQGSKMVSYLFFNN